MGPRDVVYDVATTVQRPVDTVARFLFDPRTMPQWSAVLTAVQDPDDQPLHRRGRYLQATLQILGVPVAVVGHLEGLSLEERRGTVTVRAADGDGEVAHELELVERDGATVVHFRNRVTPPSWLAESVEPGFLQTYVETTAHFALGLVKAILDGRQEDGIRQLSHRAGRRAGPASE